MAAEPPPDKIVFQGEIEASYYERVDDIPAKNFNKVKLDGDKSIYIVYPEKNQCGHGTPPDYQVVTSTDYQNLKPTLLPPKSAKGFSKEGIILFETFQFGGMSQNYIGDVSSLEDVFPTGNMRGVSSVMVISGVWELYEKENPNDPMVVNGGKTQVGPGESFDMPMPSDKVHSIKRIRT